MVAGFGSDGVPEATLNFARGTREDPRDPHFGDREESWMKGEYTRLPFRDADVAARATESFVRR
jgi:acyl-homoserine lactone acylase PvdQ